jgi:hypothetical protein
MEKYGFVYIWFDRKHKRFYIGSHWGTTDDGYVCSSPWMKRAYRNRQHDFKRKILKYVYTNRHDLLDEETKFLVRIKDSELKIRYYNLHNKNKGHWSATDNSLTVREKISRAGKGRKSSAETRKKQSEALKGKPTKPRSAEHNRKIALAKAGKPSPKKGKPGKAHSSETKAKIAEAGRGRTMSEENKRKLLAARWPKSSLNIESPTR